MPNLKTLHASRCSIQRTADMSNLLKLTTVELDQNDLEIDVLRPMPAGVQKLNLSLNHFSAFPPVLKDLVFLVELNLSGNRIETMVGIGSLSSLVMVNFDDNQIVEISPDAAQLTKLRQISLKKNRIAKRAISFEGQSIPADFFVNTSVEKIDLEGNLQLQKSDVLEFDGIDTFLERRKRNKEKNLQGGAMTDFSLFGLD